MAAPGKITVRMAAAIRADAAAGASYTALEAKYGVHRTTVSRVARGATAADAPGPLAQPKVRWKLRCIRGHLLAETRPKNNRNCLQCNADRNRAARARKRAENEQMTRL